jgi:hypothetical protein
MKKLLFLIFPLLFLAAMFSSCKKDNASDSAEKFSTLSVEANKAIIETAGVDFVKAMKRMRTIQTIDAIYNLGDILSSSDSIGFILSKDSKIFSTLETFAATANGEKKPNDLFKTMVSSRGLTGDPKSIKEFWDSNVGTYTWNKTLNDWTKVLGGNKFIFLFPSTNIAATNDATLTIYNYTGIQITDPFYPDYTGDLPVSLSADLKVGTKTLITLVFGAEYNTGGIPKAIASDLTIENFKFEVDISNDTKAVSVSYKFLENTTVILDLGAIGAGLFTKSNYDANTTTKTDTYSNWEYVWNPNTQQYDYKLVTYTNSWDETAFEEILNSANAHFQLFNIALRGDIDVKGLVDQLKLIDADKESSKINQETADNRYASKINEYLNLRLVNVTNNEIMAKAQSYVVMENNYGTPNTYIDFRLTFNDGSLIDMQTYTDSGFSNFVNELNGLINDINSEFNAGIETIYY